MGGGLMQLVAYGALDIYLTGNPQITFFKVVYRRHTNFAVESIEQTFNGQADFGKRVTATISRNGDLIQQMYLEIVTPPMNTLLSTLTYGFGNAIIKQVDIEIGGQLIDRQYGNWMNIWTELTIPEGKRAGYDNMVGNKTNNTPGRAAIIERPAVIAGEGQLALPPVVGVPAVLADTTQAGGLLCVTQRHRFYVPLQFWFNRNPGLALPLIALQYHEVKLNLELRNASELINVTVAPLQGALAAPTTGLTCKLFVDYIYLDTDERRRFAQVSHEYLIEQVQFTGSESIGPNTSTKNVTLNFNHPVKELIWVHNNVANTTNNLLTGNRWFNYSSSPTLHEDTFNTALLQLNGHDRFSVRHADYFRKVQNYEHHCRVPRVSNELDVNDNRSQFIYTYSFALSPEEHQPSGSCNFSRIDNAVLQLNYSADPLTNADAVDEAMNLFIYAVNYNVLRIMSGMGGLAYSN